MRRFKTICHFTTFWWTKIFEDRIAQFSSNRTISKFAWKDARFGRLICFYLKYAKNIRKTTKTGMINNAEINTSYLATWHEFECKWTTSKPWEFHCFLENSVKVIFSHNFDFLSSWNDKVNIDAFRIGHPRVILLRSSSGPKLRHR